MIISQIVAVSKNFVIGDQGKIPWHSSADFSFFKKTTMGKPIIMGRKTYESIGKTLPGRLNIVITRSKNSFEDKDQLKIMHNISDAIALAKKESTDEIFIIGGAGIYRQTKDITDRLYLTIVDVEVKGDAHFDEDFLADFKLESSTHHTDSTPNLIWRTYSKLSS